MQNDFLFAAVFFIAGSLLGILILRLAKKNCAAIDKQIPINDNDELTSSDFAVILLRSAAAIAMVLFLPWAASFKHLIGAGKIWEPVIAASVFLAIVTATFMYAYIKHKTNID